MNRCKICVLPITFPNISFNEQGICNFCQLSNNHDKIEHTKQKYRQKFENLLDKYKGLTNYDCLMGYSGGKDSTFTLSILVKKYQLNVLALTFDNGFISQLAIENIRKVTDSLRIDHILLKPRIDLLKKIFLESSKNELYPPKTIERASTICTSCMGLVKFITLKVALEKKIPFIVYGWSPGQVPIIGSVFKNNPIMIKNMQKIIKKPLLNIIGKEINRYFLDEEDFNKEKNFPYNISPLAFLEYNEDVIYSDIKNLGWQKPKDTDANSTNCLLNSYANIIHKKKYNFHPYAFELSNMVREGYMSREVALSKLETEEDPLIIDYIEKALHG